MDSYRGLDGALLTVEDAYVDVYFTTAQIKALHGTPMILVPAPGVGYYLEFVHAWLMLDYATAGLTEADDNLQIVYGVAAAIVASQTIECTGFIDQVADTYTNALPKIDMIATPVQLDNLALYLYNPNDEFGGTGGSVLRVRTHARAHQKLI